MGIVNNYKKRTFSLKVVENQFGIILGVLGLLLLMLLGIFSYYNHSKMLVTQYSWHLNQAHILSQSMLNSATNIS